VSGGVAITNIDPNGQAAIAGLRRGDVIISVNSQAIDSAQTFQRQASALRAGRVVRLRIVRDRRPLFIAFEYGG
jgi:serine protease Do